MRPLPDDDQNPLASGASGDDMIIWLAYREAAAMLGVEASNPQSVTSWVEGLQREVTANPGDTIRSLHLAMALLWLGKTSDHEALCRQLLAITAASDDPQIYDRAAKAYLLRSKPEPETRKLAAAAARRTLESAGDPNLAWFRTVAGMAAFREEKLAEADALLSEAIASPLHENQRRLALAFRAMARSRAGRPVEANADLAELAKLNLSLPERARMSAVVRDQDQLAVRLAFEEAATLLKSGSSPNQ
jgi:tetratricopeptide (TPR) repeat protein